MLSASGDTSPSLSTEQPLISAGFAFFSPPDVISLFRNVNFLSEKIRKTNVKCRSISSISRELLSPGQGCLTPMEKKDAFLVSSIVIFVSKDFQAIARNIGMTCYDVSGEKFWGGHTDKYYYGHRPCSTNFLEGQDLVVKPNLRPSSTSTLLFSSSSSSSSCFKNVCC